MVTARLGTYAPTVKQKHFSPPRKRKFSWASRAIAAVRRERSDVDLVVALAVAYRRAYRRLVNQGSIPNHAMQHWQEAGTPSCISGPGWPLPQ